MKNLKFLLNLKRESCKKLVWLVKEIENRGAGEIFLISIENDGTTKKINFDLLQKLRNFQIYQCFMVEEYLIKLKLIYSEI